MSPTSPSLPQLDCERAPLSSVKFNNPLSLSPFYRTLIHVRRTRDGACPLSGAPFCFVTFVFSCSTTSKGTVARTRWIVTLSISTGHASSDLSSGRPRMVFCLETGDAKLRRLRNSYVTRCSRTSRRLECHLPSFATLFS